MNVSSHPMCKSFNPNTSQLTKFVLIYDLIPCRHRRWLFLAFEAKTWIEWKIRGFRKVFSSALGFGVKWLFRGIFNECQISLTITTARLILIHTKNSIVIKFKQHSTIPYGYFQYNKPFFTWGFFFFFYVLQLGCVANSAKLLKIDGVNKVFNRTIEKAIALIEITLMKTVFKKTTI